MAEIKCIINDPKTGKSYQKAIPGDFFRGKKLNEKVDGKPLGLDGYELQITGGSDDAGFPMRSDLDTNLRRKVLLTGGTGVKIKRAGMRKRKSVRGNTIGVHTAQVNLKVIKHGSKAIDEALGLVQKEAPTEEAPKEEAKPEEKKEEAKPEEKKEEAKPEEKKEEAKPEEKKEEAKPEEKKEKAKEEAPKEEKKE